MQNENLDTKSSVEGQIPIENKLQEEGLSPLRPQQLPIGSTCGTSQVHTIQNLLTPPPLPILVSPPTPPPPPLRPELPHTMMANLYVAPRITNIVHIP